MMHAHALAGDVAVAADAVNNAALRRELCFRLFFLCMVLIIFFPGDGITLVFLLVGILAVCLGIKYENEMRRYQAQLDEATATAAAIRLNRIHNRTVLVAEPAPEGAATAPENRHNVLAGMAIQREESPHASDEGANRHLRKNTKGSDVDSDAERSDGDAVYGRAQYASPPHHPSSSENNNHNHNNHNNNNNNNNESGHVTGVDVDGADYVVVHGAEEEEGEKTGERESLGQTGGAVSSDGAVDRQDEHSHSSAHSRHDGISRRESEDAEEQVEVEVEDANCNGKARTTAAATKKQRPGNYQQDSLV